MNRGYTLLWRKIWANPLLSENGRKFSRLEAWLYLTNVLATGVDDPATGLSRGEFRVSVRRRRTRVSRNPSRNLPATQPGAGRGEGAYCRKNEATNAGMVICECAIAKRRAERLSVIPERFRDSDFESCRPRNHRQEKALFLMRGEVAGSWYLTGSYGHGSCTAADAADGYATVSYAVMWDNNAAGAVSTVRLQTFSPQTQGQAAVLTMNGARMYREAAYFARPTGETSDYKIAGRRYQTLICDANLPHFSRVAVQVDTGLSGTFMVTG